MVYKKKRYENIVSGRRAEKKDKETEVLEN